LEVLLGILQMILISKFILAMRQQFDMPFTYPRLTWRLLD
jgi:hypothetical protein